MRKPAMIGGVKPVDPGEKGTTRVLTRRDTGTQLRVTNYPSGRCVYVNVKGRCMSAPRCGCCS
jgi:hypothetical protein